jgi:hypothetical protein
MSVNAPIQMDRGERSAVRGANIILPPAPRPAKPGGLKGP